MNSIFAATLAIGTEVSSGQIVNTNAAWIAQRLEKLGIACIAHSIVPDDSDLALYQLETISRLLIQRSPTPLFFVIGGLGPTSDDLTREIVAHWAQKQLNFDPHSWKQIEASLRSRGIRVSENNRQQCLFPEHSRILPNPVGTANAFYLDIRGVQTWVLPGPPPEMEAIWNASIGPELQNRIPEAERVELHTWQCTGQAEALLAETVEAIIRGSGLTVGYRVHMPYVEIKIWCKKSELQKYQPLFRKLGDELSPFLAEKKENE